MAQRINPIAFKLPIQHPWWTVGHYAYEKYGSLNYEDQHIRQYVEGILRAYLYISSQIVIIRENEGERVRIRVTIYKLEKKKTKEKESAKLIEFGGSREIPQKNLLHLIESILSQRFGGQYNIEITESYTYLNNTKMIADWFEWKLSSNLFGGENLLKMINRQHLETITP